MIAQRPNRPRRSGAAIVETALVILIMLVLMAAVFEYGRFLMVVNVCENAVREGARFAVVQVSAGQSSADINSKTAGIKKKVLDGLGQIKDWLGVTEAHVTVVALNPTTFADAGGWNTAGAGNPIAVRLGIRQTTSTLPTGTAAVRYRPVVTQLTKMPAQINIFAQASMGSEAN